MKYEVKEWPKQFQFKRLCERINQLTALIYSGLMQNAAIYDENPLSLLILYFISDVASLQEKLYLRNNPQKKKEKGKESNDKGLTKHRMNIGNEPPCFAFPLAIEESSLQKKVDLLENPNY